MRWEICALGAMATTGRPVITLEDAKQAAQRTPHVDSSPGGRSALRSSPPPQPSAAPIPMPRCITWVAVEAGDFCPPCRRLLVIAAEDIGLAYPQAIVIVKAAVQLGLPEARIRLARPAVPLATAPKSNAS